MATAAASRFRFLTMATALTLATGLLVATPAAADELPTGTDAASTTIQSAAPSGDEAATPEPASEPASGSGDAPTVDASTTSTGGIQDELPVDDAPADDTAPEDDTASDLAETPEIAPDAAVEAPTAPEGASGFAAAPPSVMSQGGVTLTWNGWDMSQGPRNPSEEAILNGYRGQTAGIATISTTDIEPGELVTVTATYLGPESECRGNGYGAATIMWPGAVGLLDYGPKTGDIPSVSVIVNSDGTRIDWGRLRVGMTVTATFAAPATFPTLPSEHHFPNVAFRSSIWTPERCALGQSYTMLLWAGGYLANPTPPDNDPPQAAFSWTVGAPGTTSRDVTFVNESTDDFTVPSALRARWTFGDGTTSTELNPVHRYEHPGRYEVVLTVFDQRGDSSTTLHVVDVLGGLVVNSTGDLPAEDPAIGCDTGGTIGASGAPECTLRAAIETANAAGGGEITFDIEGSPVIAVTTALPAITTPTTIDGTTQPGGWVEVDGVPGSELLTITGGPVSATGLALHDATNAIRISGGSDHVLEGLRVGTDLGGTATGDTAVGILIGAGTGTRVLGNTISADQAGVMVVGEGVGVAAIEGNAIGASPEGSPNGDVEIGVFLLGAPATVDGNLIRAVEFGVMAAGAGAAGTAVTDNRVGTTGSTPFAGVGTGIVVEGIPDAVVRGNVVHAGNWGGILVAGGVMIETGGAGEFIFHSPSEWAVETPSTGFGVTVDHNTVTTADGGVGIEAWAGADRLTVTGNTIGAAGALLSNDGIRIANASSPEVSGNTVFAAGTGITVRDDGAGALITGNTITGDPAGLTTGIQVLHDRTGVEISGNTVTGAGRTGLFVDAEGARVSANSVVDGGDGIVIAGGSGNEVRDNLVGATAGLGSVPGNRGTGIEVNGGDAVIRGNTVVGSGEAGIDVDDDASATLRGNRVWDSTGAPITTTIEPLQLLGAIIADTEGQRRTTLVVTGLPDGTGTIEVFANDSCGPDGGEARVVTDIRRETIAGRDAQIIQVLGDHDHFTLTFTAADGRTGDLSACADRMVQPDSDGDGSPDPLDALMRTEADPGVAVIATTDEQLLVMIASEGDIEGLAIIDDPAPSSHPADWSLPYGTFSFRVTGLEPGGSTGIVLTTYFQDAVLAGTGYWKYGPPTPGAAPSWYDFALDESGTGAARTAANIPGLGYRVTFALSLTDGARGDADNIQNGSITDPGGPVSTSGSTTTPSILTPPAPAALSATGSTTPPATGPIWIAIIAVLLGAAIVRTTARSNRKAMRRVI